MSRRAGGAALDQSEIEDAPGNRLKFSNQLIELGRLSIELSNSDSQTAQISDHIRKSFKDVANGVEFVTGRGVKLCGFDEVSRNFEFYRSRHFRCMIGEVWMASHNTDYG